MSAARFADGNSVMASVLAGSVLSLAVLAQEAMPSKQGDADLANGRRLYAAHCQRCHGSDGDDVTCSGDMTPLAGLGRRPRVDLVGQVLSPSFFLRGVSYEGANARDLAGFLLSLKGEKGFADPGLLCMPRLLSKKYGLLDHYRVIDLRDGAAYAQGHIPNATRWPSLEEGGERRPRAADVAALKLGLLAVRPEMAIIIYDDAVTPASALLWWDLVRAGQNNVAILDGGFRRWVEEGNQVTTAVTPLAPGKYASGEAAEVAVFHEGRDHSAIRLTPGLPQPSVGTFDWERTVTDGRLRRAVELREYLNRVGLKFPGAYRFEGSDAEAAFLVYLLRLLGHKQAHYDPIGKLLTADSSAPPLSESRTHLTAPQGP
jgi:3-mercaptopyruvate sulfurtransferase SseA